MRNRTHLHKNKSKELEQETSHQASLVPHAFVGHASPPNDQPSVSGNSALPLIIQPKLTLGSIGDRYEQEADDIANRVTNDLTLHRPPSTITQPPKSTPVDPTVETAINQARGGGQPLADEVRQPMEQAFGTDFSNVRIHTDQRANELNQALSAQAFTTNQDIFFRQGEYQASNPSGQQLLAHELAHVVQQSGSSQAPIQRVEREVGQTPEGSTIVLFDHNELPPTSDTHIYEPISQSDAGDLYLRRSRNYQSEATARTSSRNYGTMPSHNPPSSVTYNPSTALFPEAAALDKMYYEGAEGRSRIVNEDDVQGLLAHATHEAKQNILNKVKEFGLIASEKIKQKATGHGLSADEVTADRTHLLQNDYLAPNLRHYLLVHEEGLARKALVRGTTMAANKLSMGISGAVLAGARATHNLAIATALWVKVRQIRAIRDAQHDETWHTLNGLVLSIGFLCKKLAGGAFSRVISQAPGLEGAADTAADTATSQGIDKLTGKPVDYVKDIINQARLGVGEAYAVADVLGIPHEIFIARGSEAVVMTRLGMSA